MLPLPLPPAFLYPQDRNRRYVPLEKTPVSPRPTDCHGRFLSLHRFTLFPREQSPTEPVYLPNGPSWNGEIKRFFFKFSHRSAPPVAGPPPSSSPSFSGHFKLPENKVKNCLTSTAATALQGK